MMYASSRNLPSRAPQGRVPQGRASGGRVAARRVAARRVVGGRRLAFAPVLAVCLVLTLCLACAASVWAGSSSTAPHTGMEGGMRHAYGPEGEGQKDKRIPTGGSTVDAYGNAIVPGEDMEEAPRQRPRPGAYGVRPAPPPSRPLPDLPAESKGWKFR